MMSELSNSEQNISLKGHTLRANGLAAITLARLRRDEAKQADDLRTVGYKLARKTTTSALPSIYDLPNEVLVDTFRNLQLSVDDNTGILLYLLARAGQARCIVEFGTSFGISSIFLAASLRDNGGGLLITSEADAGKASHARDNLARAGLADLVEIREGDALNTLASLAAPVDLVLLDGFPKLHLEVLQLIESSLHEGSIVISDCAPGADEALAGFRAHISNPDNGYHCLQLRVNDGLDVAIRSRD